MYSISSIKKCIEKRQAEYPDTENIEQDTDSSKQLKIMGCFSAAVIVAGVSVGIIQKKTTKANGIN